MRLRGWLRAHRTLASVTALAVLIAGPVTLAVLHEGFPLNDVDLNSRDVWVTNSDRLLAGRLNMQIEQLNAGVAAPSKKFDVMQDGRDVFIVDDDKHTIERIDPAYITRGQKIVVQPGSQVSYGGDRLAIVAPDGRLWIVDATGQLRFDDAVDEPVAELGDGGVAVVALDGTVFAVSVVDGELWRIQPRQIVPEKKADVDVVDPELTTVGSRAVILDDGRLIFDDGGSVELPDGAIRLQQPGPERDQVIVAMGDALLPVGLNASVRDELDAGGTNPAEERAEVAAPVVLGSCIHGAWSSSATYLGVCEGKADAKVTITDMSANAQLEFRVNRSVIALNDIKLGQLWVPSEVMSPLEDFWDVINPPEDEADQESDEESAVQTFEETIAKRKEENTTPVARGDGFGVRPGKTTILPVLDNDLDVDGDVLTISNMTAVPASAGIVQVIDDGRALQFVPAAGSKSGTVSFRYTVSDGRLGIAEAQVDVTIHPGTVNAPAEPTRTATVQAELGQTVTHDVLTDWRDPDGDDLVLVGATSTTDDIVRFTPDGLVTFTAAASEIGEKAVTLSVSDGKKAATGSFMVKVSSSGSTKPVGTPDYVRVFAGDAFEVTPLANDLSPSGEALSLTKVEPLGPGLSPQLDPIHAVVTGMTAVPGTHYLKYTLAAGSEESWGLVRVDVLPVPEAKLAPIAVKDTAYVRPNEPTVLDALLNDVSPSGDVLAIQSVTQDVTAKTSVEILSSTRLRITAPSGMTTPEEFTYTISDGSTTASGEPITATAGITIVPVPELVHHQAPIAADDAIKVRAGDIASVSVLENDYHPDGVRMVLDPQVVQSTLPADDGLVFISGERLRFQAPEKPGVYAVSYRISDAYEEASTAKVVITVAERDADTNAEPQPRPIIARVFQGASITVDVPLDGVDPDGDSVVLLKPAGSSLGEIGAATSTSFTYTAKQDASGTDEFTYEVRDTFLGVGQGVVRIAVIPRGDKSNPTAVDDQVAVRPDRVVAFPVLANDSDPNGYPIELKPAILDQEAGISAEVDGANIIITAASKAGTYSFRYTITNGQGGTDAAMVTVTVDPKAALQPPTAVDHVVEPDDVVGLENYTVDVLSGAVNPGGLPEELVVDVVGPNADLAQPNDDGTVTVTLGTTRQAIAYRLTNERDELGAMAFIIVPKRSDSEPPRLQQRWIDEPPIVRADTVKTFELTDLLDVPSGRPPILVNVSSMTAGRGDIEATDKDTFEYTMQEGDFGETYLTFTVTDGESADDPNGNLAVISMLVILGDPDGRDRPASFPDAVFEIEPGEEQQHIDLRTLSSHPNPEILAQLNYSDLAYSSGPIEARIDSNGHDLYATAPASAKGEKAVATFTISFDGGPPSAGQVTIVVVASKRPLAQAVDDIIPDARPNSSYSIPVTSNDFNPFQDTGGVLTVINAEPEGDSIGAQIGWTDSAVTVRTGATKSGTISVIYTIQDKTKDATRNVQGRATVVVRSAPEPVTSVVLGNPTGHTVTVLFQPPVSSNGAEITGYVVRMSGSPGATSRSDCVPGAQCVFTGRDNGQLQTIVVDATNAVGTTTSAPSTIIPYGIPSAPTGAVYDTNSSTATASITPRWAAPVDDGGGQITYHWTASSAPSSGQTTGFSGASRNAGEGDYSFTVQACNPAGCSNNAGASRHIDAPPPSVALSKGGATGAIPGCSSGNCNWFHVEARNFTPNATFAAACYSNDGSGEVHIGTTTYRSNNTALRFDGSGDFSGDVACWDGFGNVNRVNINGVWSNGSDF